MRHDLAEHGLPAARPDVPAPGQDGQSEEHGAQDESEQHLGALGPHGPGLAEERDAVGDGLDAGQRAAAGGEGLEDEQERHRLEPGGGQLGRPELRLVQAQRVDQPDHDDGEQPHDEHHGRQQEGPGRLAQAAQVEHGDEDEDAQAQRHGRTR